MGGRYPNRDPDASLAIMHFHVSGINRVFSVRETARCCRRDTARWLPLPKGPHDPLGLIPLRLPSGIPELGGRPLVGSAWPGKAGFRPRYLLPRSWQPNPLALEVSSARGNVVKGAKVVRNTTLGPATPRIAPSPDDIHAWLPTEPHRGFNLM